jgi:hypothetical protein
MTMYVGAGFLADIEVRMMFGWSMLPAVWAS